MNSIEWIADASSNHCGSLETMYRLVKVAKESGATIFKTQHWVTERFINKERFEKLKIAHQKDWSESVFDTYKRYEIPLEWIPKIKKCCDDNDIEFMNSEYDLESFDYTNQFVKRIKLGSGDINYKPMLKKVRETKKEVFIATGASDKEDIINAYNILRGNDIKLFICNTNYSSDDNQNMRYLNLNILKNNFNSHGYNYDYYDGLSDHTKSMIPVITAIYSDIRYIERHFQLEKNESPDSKFSLTPKEWKHMVDMGEQTLLALGDGVQKIEENEKQTRVIQRRGKDGKRPDLSRSEK